MVNSSIIPFVKTVNIPAKNISSKSQGSEIRLSFEKRPQCKLISQCATVKSSNTILPNGEYFIQHRYLYIQQRCEWREMKKKFWFVPNLQFIYEESDSCPLTLTPNIVDFEAAETDQESLSNSWSEISTEDRKDSYRKPSEDIVEKDSHQTEISPTDDYDKHIRREKIKVLKYKHLKKKIKKFQAFCK